MRDGSKKSRWCERLASGVSKREADIHAFAARDQGQARGEDREARCSRAGGPARRAGAKAGSRGTDAPCVDHSLSPHDTRADELSLTVKQAHVVDLAASSKAELQAQLDEQASFARTAEAEQAATTRALAALRQRHRSTLQGLQEKEAGQAEASRQLSTQSSEHSALAARYKTLKIANEQAVSALAETKKSLEQAEAELEQTKATVEEQKKGRDKLQKTISMWKERSEEKQKELDAWLREEKNEGGVSVFATEQRLFNDDMHIPCRPRRRSEHSSPRSATSRRS